MSVVAVKIYDDKIVIGSDNQWTLGYSEKETKDADKPIKLFKIDNITFGAAWNAKDAIAMKQYLQEQTPKWLNNVRWYYDFFQSFYEWAEKKWLGIDKTESVYIFVAEGKVFQIMDFFVDEIHDFYAIGSGASKAMIGLHLWHTVEEALLATCKYDLYCHDPVVIHEIPKGKKKG